MTRTFYMVSMIALSGLVALQAEDLTLKDGTVLKNYKVYKETPQGLVIFHEAGGLTAGPDLLPDFLVEKYSLSKETIKKAKQEAKEKTEEAYARARVKKRLGELKVNISGNIVQVVSRGILLKNISVINPGKINTESKRVDAGVYTSADYADRIFSKQWVFVECESSALLEDQSYSADVWRAGFFTYTSTNGAARKVRRYVSKEETAAKDAEKDTWKPEETFNPLNNITINRASGLRRLGG